MTTIDRLHIPTAMSHEKAVLLAEALSTDERDGWTYAPVLVCKDPNGPGLWAIEAYDEDGELLGKL